MTEAFQTLTGRWLGRYEYAQGTAPVAFEADLLEDDALSGETIEQNSFRPDMGAVLTATLHGARSATEVQFVKTYFGFRQEPPIYTGTVDARLCRITGSWRFAGFPGFYGRFVMMRKPLAGAALAAKRQSMLEDVGQR